MSMDTLKQAFADLQRLISSGLRPALRAVARTRNPKLFESRLSPLTLSHLALAANSHFPPTVSLDHVRLG